MESQNCKNILLVSLVYREFALKNYLLMDLKNSCKIIKDKTL
jgi:hypothetical protein